MNLKFPTLKRVGQRSNQQLYMAPVDIIFHLLILNQTLVDVYVLQITLMPYFKKIDQRLSKDMVYNRKVSLIPRTSSSPSYICNTSPYL